ncbi:MAG: alpha/beta hydrolase [Hyphomicrobiaceae bacterium]
MFLHDRVDGAIARVLLAHGAGAPMDHPWMNDFAGLLVDRRLSVARFEFGFMAARRTGAKLRPAPRGDKLVPEYVAAVEALAQETGDGLPLLIGGKSLGGRVASLAAPELYAAGQIASVVCLGYPFHPPKKPESLRTAHLETFDYPALIVQGTRDPLGSRAEVEGYTLDPRIRVVWLEDGDHDLKPRRKSGFTHAAHLATAADAIASMARAHRS